jgi:hypothetical protein
VAKRKAPAKKKVTKKAPKKKPTKNKYPPEWEDKLTDAEKAAFNK